MEGEGFGGVGRGGDRKGVEMFCGAARDGNFGSDDVERGRVAGGSCPRFGGLGELRAADGHCLGRK